jgi:hypothetical protein
MGKMFSRGSKSNLKHITIRRAFEIGMSRIKIVWKNHQI